MAEPNPTEVSPWYLRNINQALALDETSGNVYVRTGITGDVYITGPVTIPGTVTVNSSPADPVHTHVSEVGTSGILTTPYMPVGGTVTVDEITNTVTVEGSVSVDNFPTTFGVTQGTSPWVVSGNVNATLSGTSTVQLSATQTDAFGRLRVSNPFTLFDSKSRYYDHGQFSTATSTGGTVDYDANSSTFNLNVTGSSGSSVIRETTKVFPYQPGKSLLIMNTFSMAALDGNKRQRVGFFGENNGIFFEANGTTLNMVIRSSSSGVMTEDRIPQSAWNGDRLNGAGGANNPSNITLNPTYDQIFWIDVEWLGVGSVRCGFVINGTFYTCHTFHHANIIGNTTTYMTTATLPVRYEITNTAASSVGTLKQICSTVISEGGYNQYSTTQAAGTGITPKDLGLGGVYRPIVSIRLASGRLDSIVLPRQVDILSPDVAYFRWQLLLNPTLTDDTWAGTSTTGTVQYDTAATAVSGGTEIQSGYVSSRDAIELGGDFFAYQLGRTLAGVSDVVTLAIASTSNNPDILAQIGWQELT